MKLATLQPSIRFEKKWPDVVAGMLLAIVFIIGGMQLARWIWLLILPEIPILPLKAEQSVSSQSASILAGKWFSSNSGRTVVVVPTTVNFKLMGVYSPIDKTLGFAIFKMADGKQRSVLLHHEITPGNLLLSIKQDSVQVGQEGSSQNIVLESKISNSGSQAQLGFQFKK